MAVKFEYTGKLSDGRYFDSDSTKRVTVELDDNDLNVNEMLEEFMNFMKAVGYNFDLGDRFEVVNDFTTNKELKHPIHNVSFTGMDGTSDPAYGAVPPHDAVPL